MPRQLNKHLLKPSICALYLAIPIPKIGLLSVHYRTNRRITPTTSGRVGTEGWRWRKRDGCERWRIENARLKREVADQVVQIQILKEVNAKKW
jgi:hypothetical protein